MTGCLRDSSCKLRRLGCVWSLAQSADPVLDPDTAATSLFDVYPLGDLACLVRLRDPKTNPALLPLGDIFVTGDDGDGALFLETALGDGPGNAPGQELKLRGPVVPRGSAGGPLAPDGQGFVASGLRALPAEGSEDLLKLERDPELLHHGGLTVAAAELDHLYQSFPGFLDAACFTLPDPIVGDRIFAAVVPKPGQSVTLDALQAFLREQGVAPYKLPDRLVVVSTIPRDANGAVLRGVILRDNQ